MAAAVDLFYGKVLSDPDLAPYFADVDQDRLRAHQRTFLTAALGGPDPYRGRDMAGAHAGLGITEVDFDSVVAHLADTLGELGVPARLIGEIAASVLPLKPSVVGVPAPGP